jgi:hypothetical protein
MVLEVTRRGGWSLLLEAKSLKTTQRGLSVSSSLRLHGSCDVQTGGWSSYPEATQWLYSLKLKPRGQSGSSLQQHNRRVCLLFLMERWRSEMLKLMVLISENQSDCHRSVWQRFLVLRSYGTRPGLNRPTMPAKAGERGLAVLTLHQSCDRWEGLGLST